MYQKLYWGLRKRSVMWNRYPIKNAKWLASADWTKAWSLKAKCKSRAFSRRWCLMILLFVSNLRFLAGKLEQWSLFYEALVCATSTCRRELWSCELQVLTQWATQAATRTMLMVRRKGFWVWPCEWGKEAMITNNSNNCFRIWSLPYASVYVSKQSSSCGPLCSKYEWVKFS